MAQLRRAFLGQSNRRGAKGIASLLVNASPLVKGLAADFYLDSAVIVGVATLVAGTGSGGNVGFSQGPGSTVGDNTPFGSLSNVSVAGGRTIAALYFQTADRTYLVLNGNSSSGFLAGLQIWINGTMYTCTSPGTDGVVSFATVSASNLFTSGTSYSVSFTAPSSGANANAVATISLGGAGVATAPASAAANGALSLGGGGGVTAPVAAQGAAVISLGGGAVAQVQTQAQAAGFVSLGGAAQASTGAAPIVAQAAAVISLGGAASATAPTAAVANGSIALGGAGVGAAPVAAQAAGLIGLGGGGTAALQAQAQAAGAIAITATGTACYGVPAIVPPAGVFPDAQAALDVVTHFNAGLSTGTYARTASGYTVTGAASLVFTLPAALTGNYWVSYNVLEEQPGSSRAGYLSPSYTPNALRGRGRNLVFNTPAVAGSTQVRIITASNFAGEIEDIQLIDMTPFLAMPADVWIALGQSNDATTTQSLGYDKTQDAWFDPRAHYFPGAANTAYGTTLGEITALRAPLQMQSNTAEALTPNMISSGVSPAVSFARNIMPKVAAGRRLVIIAAAVSGTGLEGPAAPWNPASSNPFAYNHMMSLVTQAMAALPAGSVIRGMISASGESDTSANMSTHSAAVNAMLVASGNAWVVAGYCAARPPCILIGPPPDATRANQAVLVATYAKLDKFSGDPTSIPNVHVAPTGGWGMEDSTHRTAAASRLAGTVAANLAIARGLIISGDAPVVAQAVATISLGGSAAAVASAQAQASGLISLGGGGTAAAPVQANAAGAISLGGAAQSTAPARAQATATLSLGGAAIATSGVAASASGTLALGGSGQASVGAAPATATATATLSLTGFATATALAQAQGNGAIAIGGAAVAIAGAAAQAIATIPLSGAASVIAQAKAAAQGNLTLGGSASAVVGYAPITGQAAADIALGSAAVATALAQAQSTAAIALGAVAVARADATAQGAGMIQMGGSATAMIRAAATSAASLPLGSSSDAMALLKAIAAGQISLSGTATTAQQPSYATGRLAFATGGPRQGTILNTSPRRGKILIPQRRGTIMEITT